VDWFGVYRGESHGGGGGGGVGGWGGGGEGGGRVGVLVVGTRRMMGSRRVVFSTDKAAKVASTYQFFDFILECFTVLYSMAMIAVITTIFSHVCVGGSGRLAWWWDEVGL